MKYKEVWYQCSWCHTEYHVTVKCTIEEGTGRLVPVCKCGTNLIKRVKK